MADCSYQHNGEWVTKDELEKRLTEERYVMNDTGPNTDALLSPMVTAAAYANPIVGSYEKYLAHKKAILRDYENRIKEINAESNRKNVSKAQLDKLKVEKRGLEREIHGIEELGEEGLKDEIKQLETVGSNPIQALGYYVEKDLRRLDKLSLSKNLADLKEADSIINFYVLAGTFEKGVSNPFFEEDDIFLPTGDYKLPEDTIKQFQAWANDAKGLKNRVDTQRANAAVDAVNNSGAIIKTYGTANQFNIRDLTNADAGLGDATWIDMMVMDITKGIFSKNGLLPQVMFDHLGGKIAEKNEYSRDFAEKVDKQNPGVIARLKELRHTLKRLGIIGPEAATYQVFKEMTKNGNETGGIIQKFTKEYSDQLAAAENRFSNSFDNAKGIQDEGIKRAAMKTAFRDLRNWKRTNTHIIEFGKISRIINNPEFAGFSSIFNQAESAAYEQELIALLGKREYEKQIAEQEKQLRRYISEKESRLEEIMVAKGVTSPNQLDAATLRNFEYWKAKNSPAFGIEDYFKASIYSDHVDTYNNYNVYVPRKYKPNISKNQTTDRYVFGDTADLTGHYNTTFEQYIENDKILGDFYDLLMDGIANIKEVTPADLIKLMSFNSYPAMRKSIGEILNDHSESNNILIRLYKAFQELWDRFRQSFGVTKQSEISTAVQDPLTGKFNYSVNDHFLRGNTRQIETLMTIEKEKFLQTFNRGLLANQTIKQILRFSSIDIDRMNPDALRMIATYMNIDTVDKAEIIKRNGGSKNIEVGKLIKESAIHDVVQSQSFDLAKVMKYSVNMAMTYAAKNEALPMLEVLKGFYENIKKPKTNNMTRQLTNLFTKKAVVEGTRQHANRQMENWFGRVPLDNYGLKHRGQFGTEKGLIGKNIYSKEEKARMKEIDDLLENEKDPDKIKKLEDLKASMGKSRTATALFDNILAWIRTLGIGYNPSSAITNMLEGYVSNMMLASTGEYFESKYIYYGYHVVKASMIKNMTGGKIEHPLAKKLRKLIDATKMIQDNQNELQKSSVRTYSDKFEWASPHAINKRVEYVNQGTILVAMLKTLTIKDKNGNESSVWDAYTEDGVLKTEFETPENIENWNNLKGTDYKNFRANLGNAITLGHGNYDELKGMMAKSYSAGKAAMMFKTWLPQQLYWRFAIEQPDIQSGMKSFKGKYWSYGKGSGALHGIAAGAMLGGPLGAIIGGGIGTLWGMFTGIDTGVGFLTELVVSAKVMLGRMIGMPINTLAGREIIKADGSSFNKWAGKSGKFTQQDANALKNNMTDIAMQLTFLALFLLVKGMFYDDDDDKSSFERKVHNLLANRLIGLAQQASAYSDPVALFKSITEGNAVYKYFESVKKECIELSNFLQGKDIKASGSNAGESGLWNQSKKVFLPGALRDPFNLGFESQMERQFTPTPWDDYFKSEEKLDETGNKRDRAERRHDLKDSLKLDSYEGTDEEQIKARDKEIRKMLDDELPTPSRLRKLGMTREEYEAQQRLEVQ